MKKLLSLFLALALAIAAVYIVLSTYDDSRPSSGADNDLSSSSFSPLCIYNANSITATLTDLSYEPGKDLDATFHVENTSEHEVYFEIDGCVLDGASFPLTMYWYTISAGTSGDCDLALDNRDIAKYGIDDLHQVKFKLSIYDTVAEDTLDEFWSDDIIIDGSDYTFPLSADSYECVYDRDGIKLYDLGAIGNDACALVYNGRDSDVMLTPLSVSFDGVMDSDFVSWGQFVFSHTYYILPIECDDDISALTTAKFSIWVYSSENGTNAFLYETDPIELKLQ